ncbi:hypothetical protein MP228_003680 [Amoeboaphelidium protococcarum]|nr:hypothetical protein MP228_003680 [Amoeboaphelidium protococcarum]
MGESRQELLAWLNDLLQLNYTKIEQIGTGAALAQIFDSIFGDVQMSKLKFNALHEYEYVNNFKVLQKTFLDHKIEKVIPVERLLKCKFQDNLEFLQWVKQYWDSHFPGGSYDAVSRRRSKSAGSGGGGGSRAAMANSTASGSARKLPSGAGAASNSSRSLKQASNSPAPNRAAAQRNAAAVSTVSRPQVSTAQVDALNAQVTQLQVIVDGLEKERDFYFKKLRDVEILVQNRQDQEGSSDVGKFCQELSSVLYSTEEGFELPPDDDNLVEPEAQITDETF